MLHLFGYTIHSSEKKKQNVVRVTRIPLPVIINVGESETMSLSPSFIDYIVLWQRTIDEERERERKSNGALFERREYDVGCTHVIIASEEITDESR